ncbi:MAG: PEP-CTERM sorting domain-containing protein [Planctomycetia bacterium]|nr:PEP-CTERM sorting domain-containing protein [Planctomycetia bacterium]
MFGVQFANVLANGATLAMALAILFAPCASRAGAVNMTWVDVGNPNNAADLSGHGRVDHAYRIGMYEVTIGQYADFLNAAAKSDPYGLYDDHMRTDLNIAGISRAGTSGSYTYTVIDSANRPIAYVSWFDAARFANWMQNGQGSGSTETGAYTLNGLTSGSAPAKNAGAQVYIPTVDEWYKAAFYSPAKGIAGGYYSFATQSDSAPGNTIGATADQANYYAGGHYATTNAGETYSTSQNYLTNVGAFSASASYYGTFDQDGNVQEWNDDFYSGLSRGVGVRGGFWNSQNPSSLDKATGAALANAADANSGYGFRLASVVAVPEPSTGCLLAAGIAAGWRAIRRRCSAHATR